MLYEGKHPAYFIFLNRPCFVTTVQRNGCIQELLYGLALYILFLLRFRRKDLLIKVVGIALDFLVEFELPELLN